ncbi:unnamed protein product [Sympodiomycopsis kandeliae]
MVSFTSLVTVLAAATVQSALAAPVSQQPAVEMAVGRDALDIMEERAIAEREVINCQITNPTNSDNWSAGAPSEVTWDKSCVADPKFQEYTGTLVLGYSEAGSESLNLNVEHPLADGFKLKDGYVDFTLPSDIPTKSTYFVVLMGDSGNKSEEFTITGAPAEEDNKHEHSKAEESQTEESS